jgi:acyl-CoA synthetase (AMP-forming)/AMP-acid ligase II
MLPASGKASTTGLPATDEGFVPLFARLAAATPERIFARIGEHTLTFGALDQRSAALADWLCRNGARPGDRVALMLRNGEMALAMMLAIARIGAVWVPLNTQAVGDNLAYVLAHSNPCIVIAEPDLVPVIAACGADLRLAAIVEAGGLPSRHGARRRRRPIRHHVHVRNDGPTEGRARLAPHAAPRRRRGGPGFGCAGR